MSVTRSVVPKLSVREIEVPVHAIAQFEPLCVKLMTAWSAIILLEIAVPWIDRLTDIGTGEVIDRLSKVFGKPSNDDPLI